ncbi:MAG TPA: helix-turn-helix transcriptional regulator [Nitrospiria bacterium]|nr:helix-turn-helix transcriptional regulator [Nitrospiria bacterium]
MTARPMIRTPGRRVARKRTLIGLLLFNDHGRLLSANPAADLLVPARDRRPIQQTVRQVLRTKVANAPWASTATDAPVGPLHQTVHRSGTRMLGLQAFWINRGTGRREPMVAVLVERLAPIRAGLIGLGKAQRSYGLSPREMDVVEALRNGMSDKEIASSLGIGFETVRDYLKAIRRKLGVSTRTAIISTILST